MYLKCILKLDKNKLVRLYINKKVLFKIQYVYIVNYSKCNIEVKPTPVYVDINTISTYLGTVHNSTVLYKYKQTIMKQLNVENYFYTVLALNKTLNRIIIIRKELYVSVKFKVY